MLTKMVHYYWKAQDGNIHVQNMVGPYDGQHHVHTPDGFKRWVKNTGVAKKSLEKLRGATCGCGLKPGEVQSRAGTTVRGGEMGLMSRTHAAGWVRFQQALCKIGEDPKRWRHLLLSERHRDAVEILGRGTEDELKYEMALWRLDFPELFT